MFKIGDKVIPISKSVGTGFPDKYTRRARDLGQPFLYITYIEEDGRDYGYPENKYYTLDIHKNGGGNHFLEKDLIPFEISEETLSVQLIMGQITDEQYKEYVVYAKQPNEQ